MAVMAGCADGGRISGCVCRHIRLYVCRPIELGAHRHIRHFVYFFLMFLLLLFLRNIDFLFLLSYFTLFYLVYFMYFMIFEPLLSLPFLITISKYYSQLLLLITDYNHNFQLLLFSYYS